MIIDFDKEWFKKKRGEISCGKYFRLGNIKYTFCYHCCVVRCLATRKLYTQLAKLEYCIVTIPVANKVLTCVYAQQGIII